MLGAAIAKGRIASMDTSAGGILARRVRRGLRAERGCARQGQFQLPPNYWRARKFSTTTRPWRIVVARTFEEARAAAGKIKVRYVAEPGAYDLAKAKDGAQKPQGAVRQRAGLRRSAISTAPSPRRR